MSRFLAPAYQSLVPYTPGEQLNDRTYIKLNTNESPFPPAPGVCRVIDEARMRSLHLYSDPTLAALTGALAAHFGVSPKQVFCGNGSDDVLAFAIMAFCGKGGSLACPDVSYSFYPVFADLFGVNLTQIPLAEDFTIRVDDYVGIGKNIVIANPNAPTGLSLCVDEIERIVASNPDNIVMIDEAYVDFSNDTCVSLLAKYDNLMVVQTFSKSRSLAGLRVGFALASEAIIEDLNKIKYSFNPYNVNTLSITAAAEAIKEQAYYDKCVAQIVEQREKTKQRLAGLGFALTDSKTNFVFARHPEKKAEELYRALRERGVLVRYFSAPRIDNYLRITIGSEEQMEGFFAELMHIL
ncbi:MAG: histidinol-phosphate transaminase [Clostridiales bacterium]|nr:histidinol-phosphate transaminase [Clostridiales bacterium]